VLPFWSLEVVGDEFWEDEVRIAAKIKLPLRNDVPLICRIIRNECHLTNVACVGENHVSTLDIGIFK
jgi:hypothetical protein